MHRDHQDLRCQPDSRRKTNRRGRNQSVPTTCILITAVTTVSVVESSHWRNGHNPESQQEPGMGQALVDDYRSCSL